MKKTNLEQYFEILVQTEMFKTRSNYQDKTVAERREIAITVLKERGSIPESYK